MKKLIFSLAIAALIFSACGNAANQAQTGDAQEVEQKATNTTVAYSTVDASSRLEWRASHLGGLQKRHGLVNVSSADVQVTNGTLSNATVLIDMTSIIADNFEDDTQNQKLAGHLRSGDFFNVEKFPTAKFELISVAQGDAGYSSKLTGNLTILEVTKSITFNANVVVTDSEVSVKSEDFTVDRTNWGLVYNVEGTEGVPVDYLVANEVGFTINFVVKK